MSLFDTLNGIADTIKQQRHLINSEAATIQVSVYRFIQALGYNPFDLNDVKPQFTADPRPSGGERVDYAIMHEGKPAILIEVKPANSSLSESYWRQLHDYFNAEEVRFGILTNGLEYRIYSDINKSNIMDTDPFLVVDMLHLDEKKTKELETFRKSRFSLDRALFSARKLTVSRIIEQEFNHPSDELIKLFTKPLSSKELDQSLIQEFAPVVKEALQELKDSHISIREKARIDSDPVASEVEILAPEKDVKPVESSNQLNASISRKPFIDIPVYGTYYDVRVEATLSFSPLSKSGNSYLQGLTRIRWKGDLVSVNEAEFRAIKSINPEIVQPQWHGWDSWKLRDPRTGQESAIRELLNNSELRGQFVN